MLFMVNWELYPDKKMDAFAAFGQMTAEEDAADLGPDITLVGRWHDFASGGGAAIIECDSAEAVSSWVYNWSEVISSTVTPVLDDESARAVIKSKLAG
tara:strand:+ start:699 stop:992 length:294 start_codon:yes stop_codon:yes gene_type:complete